MIDRSSVALKPNAFRAVFEPRANSAPPRPESPLSFRASTDTTRYRVTLDYADRAMLTVSPDGQTFALLVGEIIRPQSADAGSAILDLYARRGLDFAADLHGTFALLLIDRRADQIAFVTDHQNSIKLIVAWDGATLIVSNEMSLQPTHGARVDRTAVAGFLAAGQISGGRTLFENLRTLEGGSIYRLGDGQLDQRGYWSFAFTHVSPPVPVESLQRELTDRLIEAVRIRVPTDRPLYLSLSAGDDSRTILGILADVLHVPDVRCFTYAYGSVPRPDSDESLAASLAALCGYEHRIVQSFDGDLVKTITRSARFGGGLSPPCDEVDAWVTLGASAVGGPTPRLLTGDTRFFKYDWDLKTVEDSFAATALIDFSVLSWLKPLLGTSNYDACLALTRADIAQTLAGLPPTDVGYDLRDVLGFLTSHQYGTLTWREQNAGRFFRLSYPLLDDDVVDFFLRLPIPLRRGKSLFRATVYAMFPRLFAVPHAASASYATYWPGALRQQNAALRALIQGQPSPLDDLIDPAILLALLDANLSSFTRMNTLAASALAKAYHLLRRAGGHRLRIARPSAFKEAVPALTFLRRALVLRSALADLSGSPARQPNR